jgi:hypothetical protein
MKQAESIGVKRFETWRVDQTRQPALFELENDCRPEAERTAAERYLEPTLFALVAEADQ